MQLVFKILFILVSVCLSSCLQDYDIDFDKTQNILILNAELEPDEEIKVLVALPKIPTQHGDYFTPSDAIVTVFEEGELFEVLTYKVNEGVTSGIYVSSKKPVPGKTYRVEARYGELPVVSAVQKVQGYPEIENIFFDKEITGIRDTGTVKVELVFKENASPERYFAIDNYIIVDYLNKESEVDTSRFTLSTSFEEGFRDLRGFWTVLSKSPHTISYKLLLNNMKLLESDSVLSVKFYISVDELSRDGYVYRDSYRVRNNDNYGEPNLVFSNIVNGLGIFSSRANVRSSYIIK